MKSLFLRVFCAGLVLGAALTLVLPSSSGAANAAVFPQKYDGYLTPIWLFSQHAFS
jgi:hypothetical protein